MKPAAAVRASLCHADPARALAFYTELCGFEPLPPPAEGSEVFRTLRRGGVEIRILDRNRVSRTSPMGRRLSDRPGSGVRIEIPLAEGESLQDLFVRMERSGIDIVEPPGEWSAGERSFTVADPGSYLIAFTQARPGESG